MTVSVADPSPRDRYVRVEAPTDVAHLTPLQARRIAAKLEAGADEVSR